MSDGPSIGCELQPVLLSSVPEFVDAGLISHLQVTVPNTLTYSQARDAARSLPVIAHCNLLNTFGRNHWSELRPWAGQIRTLGPVHVVEHFTAFRHPSGEKSGIAFDPSMTRGLRRQEIIGTIRRWQDMLGTPLCLENVPLSRDVETYFDFLLDVKRETGCDVACDLPHFFLSVFSAGLDDRRIRELAQALDPVQLHVGGLSLSGDGFLRDNHKLFSPWILSEGRDLFPGAAFVTLEQNHQIPAESVANQLRTIRAGEPSTAPEGVRAARGASPEIANAELGRETARVNRYRESDSAAAHERSAARHGRPASSALDLYDKFMPFLSPVSSLETVIDELSPTEAVRAAAAMSQWSLSYLSWWSPERAAGASAVIRYGEGGRVHFERRIGEERPGERESSFEEAHRFTSKRGYWVEVTSPRLRERDRDLNPKGEQTHDARAV